MKKETHPVDDFFRKSLRDHEVKPSEAARSRFLEEVSHLSGKSRARHLRWYYLLTAMVVITASVLLLLNKNQEKLPASEQLIHEYRSPDTSSEPIKPEPLAIQQPSAYQNADNHSIQKNLPVVKQQTNANSSPRKHTWELLPVILKTGDDRKSVPAVAPEKAGLPPDPVQQVSPAAETGHHVKSAATGISDSLRGNDLPSIPDPAPVSRSSGISQPTSPVDTLESSAPPIPAARPHSLTFNKFLSYSYDLAFNNMREPAHSLNLEGEFRYSRFSLTLGAGATATRGWQNYEVQYNDYLGRFKKLDSISFLWDSSHYRLQPTYYMTETTVYDSLLQAESFLVTRRYNQLKIPVTLGYEIVRKNRFTAGVKAGVEMLFFLDSRKMAGDYDAGLKKVLNITLKSDELSHTNLFLTGSLFATANLSRRIIMELEPRLLYHLNPMDEPGKTIKNEIIPGIRASLKIKF